MKTTLFLIALIFVVLSPLNTQAQESDPSIITESSETPHSSKPNMTEMFGPNYQKGDIDHSTGVVKSIALGSDLVIEHGEIHGTVIGAAITSFEVLDNTDISELSEKDYVEFLVKRGDDNVYRLLSICNMGAEKLKCL